ncbi:unnamed protein product [Sphagnum tenellum]
MLEVLTNEEGDSPEEGSEAAGDNEILHSESCRGEQIISRGGTRYYNKEQQLELVLTTQGLTHEDAHQASDSRSEEAGADDSNQTDIWEDAVCMGWLKEGFLPDGINPQERRRAQKKQRSTYANRSGKHLFEALAAGVSMVKMKIPGKRKALSASWEGPYQFIGHADGKGDFDFEEGCRICVVQDAKGQRWERSRRDLQIFYVPPD